MRRPVLAMLSILAFGNLTLGPSAQHCAGLTHSDVAATNLHTATGAGRTVADASTHVPPAHHDNCSAVDFANCSLACAGPPITVSAWARMPFTAPPAPVGGDQRALRSLDVTPDVPPPRA